MFIFKRSLIPFATSLFFFASLLVSFGAEIVYGMHPCALCLYVRYAYVCVFVTASVFCFFPKKWLFLTKASLIFLAFCLSSFHVGVEQHWWRGPSTCSGGTFSPHQLEGMTLDEKTEYLRQRFQRAPAARCDQVNWPIIGVSATIWNAVILFFLLAGIGILWKRQKIYTE